MSASMNLLKFNPEELANCAQSRAIERQQATTALINLASKTALLQSEIREALLWIHEDQSETQRQVENVQALKTQVFQEVCSPN